MKTDKKIVKELNNNNLRLAGFISVLEFEKQVLEIEGIVIIVRAPRNKMVPSYAWIKRCPDTSTVSTLNKNRFNKDLPGDPEITIISGNYNTPNPRTLLKTLRKSYEM
jgi:hypothetical protein